MQLINFLFEIVFIFVFIFTFIPTLVILIILIIIFVPTRAFILVLTLILSLVPIYGHGFSKYNRRVVRSKLSSRTEATSDSWAADNPIPLRRSAKDNNSRVVSIL